MKITSIVYEMGFRRRADSTLELVLYGCTFSPIFRAHKCCWHLPPTFSLISCGVFFGCNRRVNRCIRRRKDERCMCERCMCGVVWWFHAQNKKTSSSSQSDEDTIDFWVLRADCTIPRQKFVARRRMICSISMLMTATQQVLVSILPNTNVLPRGRSDSWK